MKIRIVAKMTDQLGRLNLKQLPEGTNIAYLKPDELAEPTDVVICTWNPNDNVHFTGRHTKILKPASSLKGVPSWATNAHRVVLVREHPHKKGNYREAIRTAIRIIEEESCSISERTPALFPPKKKRSRWNVPSRSASYAIA